MFSPRCVRIRHVLPWAFMLVAQGVWAQDTQVVVMSSYPQELINRFETAFETAHPDIDMVLQWRRSDDARLLLDSMPAVVDVYWAPSLDTFVSLADAGRFAPLALPWPGLPGRVGQLRIDDARSRFAAFEVAGFGIAYGTDWLAAQDLAVPTDWEALRDPRYGNALLLPVPSRQGFSPMIYQSILSGLGWEQGWALIGELAGRGELMGSDGGAFVEALAAGRHGLALSIDFFPQSAALNGQRVGFAYAATTLLSPAYVAQLADAPHPLAAQAFLDFVLSGAGQTLLLAPDVARLPVRPDAYPGNAPFNPFVEGVNVPAFDLSQAGSRLALMSALFDIQVTTRHPMLKTLLARIDAALPGMTGADAPRLREARDMLVAPVLDLSSAEALVQQLEAGDLALADLPVAQWAATVERRQADVERALAEVTSQ